jgi:hypothetical protein
MTASVLSQGDENGDPPRVARIGIASGPKAVSGSGAEKPADESGLEVWRNKEVSPLSRQ